MDSLLHNSRRPDISFFANGRIDISARLARLLALQPGDVIDILPQGGEWLLFVKLRAGAYQGRHEAVVHLTSRHRGTLRVWSKTLAHAALLLAHASERLRCPCGSPLTIDGKTFIPIIYRWQL